MSAANDLVSNYQQLMEDLTLVMGSKGIFNVEVDNELIYSKYDTGRHADPGEVLQLFEARYASGVDRYGT